MTVVVEQEGARMIFPLTSSDPVALARELGVNMTNVWNRVLVLCLLDCVLNVIALCCVQYLRNANAKLEFGYAVSELLAENPEKCLAQFIRARVQVDLEFRKCVSACSLSSLSLSLSLSPPPPHPLHLPLVHEHEPAPNACVMFGNTELLYTRW